MIYMIKFPYIMEKNILNIINKKEKPNRSFITVNNNAQVCKGKNSIIELLRFLFALWVLYYHGFVPYKGEVFGQGYLAVEFFFVLSGFYLMRSIDKYIDRPIKEGLSAFLKHRFKSIAIPFFIGEAFVLVYSFVFEISYNLFFGYLWYIRDLFLAMICIFLLRKCIKKNRNFYILLFVISAVSFFGFCWCPILAWPSGPFRSTAAMPLGIFASLIPQISSKEKNNRWIVWIGVIFSALICLNIIALPDKNLFSSYILVVLGYPSLIYFVNQIPINNKFLNWLGSLSFPIYAFQCILRVIEACGFDNQTWLFIILMLMVLSYSLIMCVLKRKKNCSQTNKKDS